MKFTLASGMPKEKDAVPVVLTNEKETVVSVDSRGRRTLSIGIGKRDEVTRRKLFLIARQVIATAKTNRIRKISIKFQIL